MHSSIADSLNSDNLRAQVLTNLANTEVVSHTYGQAHRTVERGLALVRRDKEAAGERPFLLGVAAKAALASGDAAQAVRLLNDVFHGVDLAPHACGIPRHPRNRCAGLRVPWRRDKGAGAS